MRAQACPECGASRHDDGRPGCRCAERAAEAARTRRPARAAAPDFDPLRLRPYVTLENLTDATGDPSMTMPLRPVPPPPAGGTGQPPAGAAPQPPAAYDADATTLLPPIRPAHGSAGLPPAGPAPGAAPHPPGAYDTDATTLLPPVRPAHAGAPQPPVDADATSVPPRLGGPSAGAAAGRADVTAPLPAFPAEEGSGAYTGPGHGDGPVVGSGAPGPRGRTAARRRRPLLVAVAALVVGGVATAAFAGGGLFGGGGGTDDALPSTTVSTVPDDGPTTSAAPSPTAPKPSRTPRTSPSPHRSSPSPSRSPKPSPSASRRPAAPAPGPTPSQVTGTVGTTTAPARPPATAPVLRRGDDGPEVADLQARLASLTIYDGSVDGHFGSRTERAVRTYQSYMGLESDPPGVYGPETRRALEAQTS
ncbi:peptidoglycan-binding protein [Streptomyces sp. NPDC059070]|uniref:peptidoglycan-binding domain-containing protein n=1 Tax=Streptomyces sp. NPDC059070 TaxID=3346713 RepID=UPI003688AF27